MTETKDSWIDSLRVYKDIRMVKNIALRSNKWLSMGLDCKQFKSLVKGRRT